MTPEQKSIHPGRILVRELKERGLTQKQLAEMLSRPEKWVCEIATGKKSIALRRGHDKTHRRIDLALAALQEAKRTRLGDSYRGIVDKKIRAIDDVIEILTGEGE